MELDLDRIRSKSAYISEQISEIRELLTRKTKEEILADPWLLKGIKYSLQTAIEAMIDLAYHLAAKCYSSAPTDARDALRTLFEHGVFPLEEYQTYTAMVGFRNRIVHGYQQVTPERVYSIAAEELGDFERFLERIRNVVASEAAK
ncbi:MAG: hypothetical protein PWQ41_781 [Bacillota bacterium]|nr:hypothetical protein [Bacillota bacterium]MDK2925007.1 hypothetical protein [Bacillota bacterium]